MRFLVLLQRLDFLGISVEVRSYGNSYFARKGGKRSAGLGVGGIKDSVSRSGLPPSR